MKRKIKNYLGSKDKSQYDNLDRILEMYLTGEIKKLLSKYTGVNIDPTINKLSKTIQLNYNYHNICVAIDFFEDKYSVVVYHAGISEDELEKLFINYDYQVDFDLRVLIKEIDSKIQNHSKLKDTTLIEKKRKLYSLIAWISLSLPMVILGGIGLYCVITKNTVQGNAWWILFFVVIPVIIWFIFDVKSKRLK